MFFMLRVLFFFRVFFVGVGGGGVEGGEREELWRGGGGGGKGAVWGGEASHRQFSPYPTFSFCVFRTAAPTYLVLSMEFSFFVLSTEFKMQLLFKRLCSYSSGKENSMFFSLVKASCLLELTWYFTGVYVINTIYTAEDYRKLPLT